MPNLLWSACVVAVVSAYLVCASPTAMSAQDEEPNTVEVVIRNSSFVYQARIPRPPRATPPRPRRRRAGRTGPSSGFPPASSAPSTTAHPRGFGELTTAGPENASEFRGSRGVYVAPTDRKTISPFIAGCRSQRNVIFTGRVGVNRIRTSWPGSR